MLERGKIVLLSGGNGSGKSTLLLSLYKKNRSCSSIMIQEQSLFSDLTIKDHISLYNTRISIFPELLPHLQTRTKHLSGGQRQMISYEIMKSKNTDYYLLDEPLAGLSLDMKKRLMEDLIAMKKAGAGVLIAEQLVEEMRPITDMEYRLPGPEKVA